MGWRSGIGTNLDWASRPGIVDRGQIIVARSQELQRFGDGCHGGGRRLYGILDRVQGGTVQRGVRLLL